MAADVLSVTVPRRTLADAIEAVFPAVAQRATIEALRHVLFSVRGGVLRVAATDMTLAVQVAVPAPDAGGDGGVAVPGKLIRDLVRLLPDGDVVLGFPGGALAVRWPGGQQRMAGIGAEAFPEFPRHGGLQIEVPAGDLARALRRALVSVAGESDSRTYLQGVGVRTHGQGLLVMGADGVRVSMCRVPVLAAGGPVSFILPAGAARVLADRLDGADWAQVLSVGPAGLTAELPDGTVVSSSFVSGEYPDLPRLVSAESRGTLVADANAFGQAVRRVSLLADEGGGIEIAAEEGAVRVWGAWRSGNAEDTVPAGTDGAAGLSVAVQPGLVLDVLRVLGSDRIVVGLSGPSLPAVFRPDGDGGFDYIVLPLIPN